MVKRYHASFPSLSYGFDSRYPLHNPGTDRRTNREADERKSGLHEPSSVARPAGMELRYLIPLTPEEQRAHGLPEPQPLAIADRVRFSELDPLDHVNNKAYLDWFEAVRVRHFETMCLPHFGDAPHPRLLLRNAAIHYMREMHRDESYIVTARAAALRTSSYTVEQQLWSGGTLRARLEAVMVLTRPDNGEKQPIPDRLRQILQERDRAVAAG